MEGEGPVGGLIVPLGLGRAVAAVGDAHSEHGHVDRVDRCRHDIGHRERGSKPTLDSAVPVTTEADGGGL